MALQDLSKLWKMIEDNYLATDAESLQQSLARHMEYSQAKTRFTANQRDWYQSLALSLRDRVMERWNDTQQSYYQRNAKRVYYLSLEFLLGRTIYNALLNLDLLDATRKAISETGCDLEHLIEHEPDAGLGNGGLGRLAACFLDSLATLQIPATGYGIRYDYGIFRQVMEDGFQRERPDHWLRHGYPWEVMRPEAAQTVGFFGHVETSRDGEGRLRFTWKPSERVVAMPFDIPVPGYRNQTINTLRLWSARAHEEFDLRQFNRGEYVSAVEEKIASENITRVLYPANDIAEGVELRLKQEYFFTAATLRDILRRFKTNNDDLRRLPDRVAIQLNDTHPAIAVPELMRILVDDEALPWDLAWETCGKTFAYTNHTVLPEALETWPVDLVQRLLPRHMQIIYEINQRFLDSVRASHGEDGGTLERLSIIQERPSRSVRMANLAITGSHSVNGVAALHTEIIKETLFRDFHRLWPERFNNKTNGITPRRWLALANPELSAVITERVGDGWVRDLELLRGLATHCDDRDLHQAWQEAKQVKKDQLAATILRDTGIEVDRRSIFDCQVKRIHEYKRQLLSALHIVGLYNRIKDNPHAECVPRTFLFAGKAAPSYHTAKLIIKLITSIGDVVNSDADVSGRLRVVFLSNYGVSQAQRIFPGADVSEQISTAGFEASGTGNMKFALNGALTIGTLDGANVEIKEEVGDDNIFIFGLTADQVREMRTNGYNPRHYYERSAELRRVLDDIAADRFSTGHRGRFQPLIDSLLHHGDYYMVLADYDSYAECHQRVAEAFSDEEGWTRRSILNTAHCGKFSSDRTIAQYNKEIWHATPTAPMAKSERKLIKEEFYV